MDFPAARRKTNTYGKGARKIRVHDLFDVRAQPSFESTAALNLDAPSPPQPIEAATIPRFDAEVGVNGDMLHGTNQTKHTSTATSSPLLTSTDSSTMFDFRSSEDELVNAKAKPPVKKRKIVPAKPIQLGDNAKTTAKSEVAVSKTKKSSDANDDDKGKRLQPKPANVKPVVAKANSGKTAPGLKRPTKPTTKVPAQRKPSSRPASPGRDVLPKTFRSKELRVSSGSSGDVSDGSSHSRLSQRSTPKRKRGVPDGGLTTSPSDLRLTSLRLTPDRGSQRLQLSSEDEDMADAPIQTPRRGRARLIDRLDAPETSTKPLATLQREVSQSLGQPTAAVTSSPKRSDQLIKDVPGLEKQPPNVSVVPTGRPRATYAKQRSHLSDVVDSLDTFPASNSQTSSQQNYSQALSFTDVASQVQLSDESDEAETFGQIKSIHELRRGGAVTKFDLDLQTILEDVESASKSVRLSGLLQLAAKLNEHTFLRHFHDTGNLQRLVNCVNENLDEVSAILIALILQSVVSAESSSPRVLSQILNALYKLSPSLVRESRSLSKLAKDRNQNISKALVKDITELEGKRARILGQTCLTVDKILLGSIESTLRHLISLKESLPKLPRTLLGELLSTFTETREHMAEGGDLLGRLETFRLLLSILEIACANHELAGSSLSASRLCELGQAVAGVMMEARHSHPEIEHSCLRLVVSLSNNDPKVCDALSEGDLLDAVFKVVDDDFLRLAGLAALEKHINNAQLESVILAVGCLLNLAECADAARERMVERGTGRRSLVDRLVDIFNSHVDQTTEVRASV